MEFLARLRGIDRKYLYLALAVLLSLPILFKVTMPLYVGPQAKSAYEAIEKVPQGKVVFLAMDWGPATRGESMWQTKAIVEHLLKTRKPFVITGYDQQGPTLTEDIVEPLAKRYGAKYGEDWVNVGFITGGLPLLLKMARNFQDTFKRDIIEKKPLNQLALGRRIKDIKDIGLIVNITGSGSYGDWITLRTTYDVPLVVACTAVITPDLYPFLDSGQLVGMLSGLKGAAEYEILVRAKDKTALRMMMSQSMAHLLIIILIILGNLALWAERRRRNV